MALPQAPTRDSFSSQQEFEEAMGFWQSRVGRILGMAETAKRTATSLELDNEMAKNLGFAPVWDLPPLPPLPSTHDGAKSRQK